MHLQVLGRSRSWLPGKLLRVMRITATLLLITALHVSATGLGQTVSYSGKNVPLEQVFGAIRQQTGYVFFYRLSDLRDARPVSVDLKNIPIAGALAAILQDQALNYSIQGNTIFISPKPAVPPFQHENNSITPPISIDIHGRVVDDKNQPVPGVTVSVKGSSKATATDENGEFTLKTVGGDAVLVFTSTNMETLELRIKGKKEFSISLKPKTEQLGEVSVEVNTGYQKLPKERATGSFAQIDNELYNRRISSDVLSKLDGITSGVYFNGQGSSLNSTYGLPNTSSSTTQKLGINVRGVGTLPAGPVSLDPLIIVDNFPYEGDINNLNPGMVESVTVLKDAAAASIWGARAGNGVIVITTKKGKLNQKMKVDFNASITIGDKPDVFASRSFLNSSDFIDVEDTLFLKGYFNLYLGNNSQHDVVSPIVEILAKQKFGQLSSQDALSQINTFRKIDVRNDFEKYIYQKSANQQYNINIKGGSNYLTYSLSVGYDNIMTNLIRNGYNRIGISSNNTYNPIKNLELIADIKYSQINMQSDNGLGWGNGGGGTGGVYNSVILPYSQFSNNMGTHLATPYNLRQGYKDSLQNLGFLDWNYRPLDELSLADNTTNQNELILHSGIKYKFGPSLNAEVQYQNETQNSTNRIYYDPQTYYVRNLINTYTQYDPTDNAFTYPFPQGGILELSPTVLNSNNLRTQLNFEHNFKSVHDLNAIAGAEIRQTKVTNYNTLSYGYNAQYGTAITNLDYISSYSTYPSGGNRIPSPNGNYNISTDRFISYYSNISYSYNGLYTLTGSARRDGANIFGVNTNNKFTPLWSAGIGWNVSRAKFYKISWLPYFKLRASYGFNGNVFNAASYLTASYNTSSLTGLQTGSISSPPNPDLRWERVKNINLGIDFASKGNILNGTIEFYHKEGLDLIESSPLAPSSGFSSFNGNAASTKTNGMDLLLNSINLSGKLKWATTLLFSTLYDKVIKYDVPENSSSIQNNGVALIGKPIFGVYSYRWEGLDPSNGDPLGYLNKQTSKDYQSIINNFKPDSLVYSGTFRPAIYGSLRNTFAYKRISLSVNIVYKIGYVFRRQSTNLSYSEIISNPNIDYTKRWQRPGDEIHTTVPSIVFPANDYRNLFYQYSEVLIDKADNIRLQDISLTYNLDKKILSKLSFDQLSFFVYMNNIGIIWKATKEKVDPDNINIPIPRIISIGIRAGF